MGLTTKPSETNKYVVKQIEGEAPKHEGYRRFNSFAQAVKIKGHSEKELLDVLQSKLDGGWYQVSDIFLEIGDTSSKIRYDREKKKVNPIRARNRKSIGSNEYFVYISRIKPNIERKYKKAY